MAETVSAQSAPEKAVDICRRFEPGAEARALLRDNLGGDAYLELLLKQELYDDAVQFVAYALPKRDAVWWACLCVWKTCRPQPPENEAAALQAAVRWVIEPTEENRRAAEATSRQVGTDTPAACLVLAAFWSEESIAPEGQPEVAPPPLLTNQMVAAALNLAAAKAEGERRAEHQRLFVQLGRDVAGGKNRWTS